jgi:predicted nucleic acid-binding protein
MNVLIDSDIAIEVLRSRDQAILLQWKSLSTSGEPVFFSCVTAAEVWAGARPSEQKAISRLFSLIPCMPVDYEVAHLAGSYLRKFAGSHGVKIADALVAATAAHHSASLWTRNRKHYPMPQVRFF